MNWKTCSEKIEGLKKEGLLRTIKDRGPLQVTSESFNPCPAEESSLTCHPSRIYIDGVEYINFASNDYLGLSTDPSIAEAARSAIDKYGFGPGASRLLSGGTELHSGLERLVAEFKGTEAALIFNSGHCANLSAIPAIAGEGDLIFSDELNHASIVDGCRLSKAKKIIYRHRDLAHLSELLKKEKGNKKIIVTDTVFSMDGDIAPLKEIYGLCLSLNRQTPDSTLLYMDDAHGTGVLGDGRDALAHFKLRPEPWVIQMGTFSKALGSYGAFIAADKCIIDWLTNSARGFIFSTALPPCVIAASMASLAIIKEGPAIVSRLWKKREKLFNGLKQLGFDTLDSETPIIPIIIGDTEATIDFSEHLGSHQIYAPAIRPPTVRTPRIRLTVSAAHTDEEIDKLLNVLSTGRGKIR